jgi:precorrin-6B methylase 2
MGSNILRRARTILAAALLLPALAVAQEQWSFPAGSSPAIIDRMVKVAQLRDGDVVVDLGSFDGRIVLGAVRSNPKVRGWGVDIEASLVAEANATAKKEGLADRAQFFHRNAFDVDLREVTVINMWLFRSLTQLLRSKILAEARPGTRVIVNGALIDNANMMGNWQPDRVDRGDGTQSPILVWFVPARVEGAWSWQLPLGGEARPYDLLVSQQFQVIEGHARVGNRRESVTEARLQGADISFVMEITVEGVGRTRHAFAGKVEGDEIRGTVTVTPPEGKAQQLPWVARRGSAASWFRTTGVNIK